MNRNFVAVPLTLLATFFVGCADNTHPKTPEELRAEQGAERTDQRTDQKVDRIDLAADQGKESSDARSDQTKAQADLDKDRADNKADLEKAKIDKQADRSKFDTEIKGRLEKVDARIADASTKAPKAKQANRAKLAELLKGVKEQRASLGDSYSHLSSVTDKQWDPTKEQMSTSIKTLEADLVHIEEMLAS